MMMGKDVKQDLKKAAEEVASYGCVSRINGVSVPMIMASAITEIERLESLSAKLFEANKKLGNEISALPNRKAILSQLEETTLALKFIDSYLSEKSSAYKKSELRKKNLSIVEVNEKLTDSQK